MKQQKPTPNPHGREGKPIILPPFTFEDAVKKALATPIPKEEKPTKRPASKRQKSTQNKPVE